ncbi:MAG: NUDIX domain-containing protein [bacterium]
MPETVRIRHAARAVIIDTAGRTLLFRARVPGMTPRVFWITPGGGIQDGEDELTAVRREVFEETGLADFELGPCVWRRDHTFPWGDGMLRQIEAYFLVCTEPFDVSTANHEEEERDFLLEHRWFTVDDLRAHDETLVPANFADLLAPLIAGIYPNAPVNVGL